MAHPRTGVLPTAMERSRWCGGSYGDICLNEECEPCAIHAPLLKVPPSKQDEPRADEERPKRGPNSEAEDEANKWRHDQELGGMGNAATKAFPEQIAAAQSKRATENEHARSAVTAVLCKQAVH